MLKVVCVLWIVMLSLHLILSPKYASESFSNLASLPDEQGNPLSPGSLLHLMKQMEGPLQNLSSLPNLDKAQQSFHSAQHLQHHIEPIYYSLMPKDTDDDATVNLLWSGGVASTYRLCKLLFVYKRKVRPIFFAQHGLDKRRSAYQERLTVRELHKYIHEHHPSTKNTLLPLHMYNAPTLKTQANRKIIEELARVFRTQPHHIAPFYLALVNIRQEQERPHTELSSRPIEFLLPHNGPHQMLRNAVEEWGTQVPFDAPDKSPDGREIGKCAHVVDAPASTKTYEQKRHASFASLFGHLRFVLPCDSPLTMHHIAKQHQFMQVLQRTWSCREPVLTEKQQNEDKQKANRLIQMPTMPVGACGHCVSCQQREWDGVTRLYQGSGATRPI